MGWQSLRPKPAQSPITMDIMVDILTIVDTGVDTVDTTDMVDTDTVDTGNVMLKQKLHPLPPMPSKNDLLMPNLKPMPLHLPTTDTTDIPTDMADTDMVDTEDTTDTVTDTVMDTTVRFLPA